MSFYHEFFGMNTPCQQWILLLSLILQAVQWRIGEQLPTAKLHFLLIPDNSSLHTKQWVALIIAHELAHQWFGKFGYDGVVDAFRLNEGFASFMEIGG